MTHLVILEISIDIEVIRQNGIFDVPKILGQNKFLGFLKTCQKVIFGPFETKNS